MMEPAALLLRVATGCRRDVSFTDMSSPLHKCVEQVRLQSS